ncbi:hypothetical protein ACLOJK_034096 [Asimina triloba]
MLTEEGPTHQQATAVAIGYFASKRFPYRSRSYYHNPIYIIVFSRISSTISLSLSLSRLRRKSELCPAAFLSPPLFQVAFENSASLVLLISTDSVYSPISTSSAAIQLLVASVQMPMSPSVVGDRKSGENGAGAAGKERKPPLFKIFVGYDSREDVAYQVCRYSLLKRSSIPLEIHPIKQSELRSRGLYWRSRGATESTEFSFTRFLTPYLAGFDGWAMFVDCDFLYTADVKELTDLIDDRYAVMCVQHDYAPKDSTKMDGVVQTAYPRKNWSSMVLYNCGHPKNRGLTPGVVNAETGAFLHRFMWLEDAEIGSIPVDWNFLVGHNKWVEEETPLPKAIHYTAGGPWFDACKDCDFADLWLKEMEEMKRNHREEEEEEALPIE